MTTKHEDVEILNDKSLVAFKNGNVTPPFDIKLIPPVPDSVRGCLEFKDNNWCFQVYTSTKNNKVLRGVEIPVNKDDFEREYSDFKKIVIVLESPAKYEYYGLLPLLPAQGVTGCGIDFYLLDRDFIKNGQIKLDYKFRYIVLLVNAVQYQCSCHVFFKKGLDTNKKNKVFRGLFSQRNAYLRKNFIGRLRNYAADYVVNCCTSGIKNVVETAIKEVNNNNISDIHPSNWYF